MQLQEHREQFDETGAAIAMLTFEAPQYAEHYAQQMGWPWTILLDGERRAYQAYGLTEGSKWKLLGPHVWPGYMKLMFSKAMRVEKPHDDVYQLGGNFMIDREGRIVMAHCSRTPLARRSRRC